MGQQNNKYLRFVDESEIIVSDPILEVKQSTVKDGGYGVFAKEFIPKGTIFCKSNPYDEKEDLIGRYINDLMYQGNAKEYESHSKINDDITNIGYVRPKNTDPGALFIGHDNNPTCYCEAIKDIAEGDELSRFYGVNYWLNHEFNKKHKIHLDNNQLPTDYVFIDEYRAALMANRCYYIFGKYVDEKYYYVEGIGISKNYHLNIDEFNSLPIFKNMAEVFAYQEANFEQYSKDYFNFKCLIDCSKPDLSEYVSNEEILGFHSTKYLRQVESLNNPTTSNHSGKMQVMVIPDDIEKQIKSMNSNDMSDEEIIIPGTRRI